MQDGGSKVIDLGPFYFDALFDPRAGGEEDTLRFMESSDALSAIIPPLFTRK